MDVKAGHSVLLEAHSRNEKTVDDILRAETQIHIMSDRQDQRGRDNVIFSCGIAGINTEWIAFLGMSEALRISSAELAVLSGVAEVPLKLRAGDFDLNSVRFGLLKLHLGPKPSAGDVEAKEQCCDQKSPHRFKTPVTVRVLCLAAARTKQRKRENDVAENKESTEQPECRRELVVHSRGLRRHSNREPPRMDHKQVSASDD